MNDESKIANLKVKKTEAEWQDLFDKFWLEATPKLFEWLRWVLTLAAIGFLAKQVDNVLVNVVLGFAYTAMMFYFFAYFSNFYFQGLPFVNSKRAEQITSLILTSALALLTYFVVRYTTSSLVAIQLSITK